MGLKYVIRHAGGNESGPFDRAEVDRRLLSGELSGADEAAVYPSQIFVPIRTMLEFENVGVNPAVTESASPDDVTVVVGKTRLTKNPDAESTRVLERSEALEKTGVLKSKELDQPMPDWTTGIDKKLQNEKTRAIEVPKGIRRVEPEKRRFGIPKKSFLIMMMLLIVSYEMMFEDEDEAEAPKPKAPIEMAPVRPKLPSGGTDQVDPEKSTKIFSAAMKFYLEDTVQGYRKAVDGLHASLRADPQNVKALAMLASSYINLIDSSNKDEKTYGVINKLIELSRSKEVQLVETLMAEVEYLAVAGRFDAGIQRLLDFYKTTGKFDPALYLYMGWLYYQKRDFVNAAKYLNQIPASALPLPKLYYLRGALHEESQSWDEAKAEYLRALKLNPNHTRSVLGLVRVASQKGDLKSVLRHIDFLASNPSLQSPSDYVAALVFKSKLALLYKKTPIAIAALEQARRLEPRNIDLRLEYYALLAQAEGGKKYQALAKMYAWVLEAERLLRLQKSHEAFTMLIQARDAFPDSEIPLEKLGDLFQMQGEFEKAQANYKKALVQQPKSSGLAVKLIDSLIKNHEPAEAQKVLAKYRTHPKLKSSIDRLAGDLAFSQRSYPRAIDFYRKSMARESVDPDVYSAYANVLSELDQCKDAQFFYSLALRLDPLNFSSIRGSAKCLLKTDGVAVAVGRIQEDLARLPVARADYLTGIAEIYYMEGNTDQALQFAQQAHQVDSEYAEAYKIEADVLLKEMFYKKQLQERALEAYKAYSDRKPSDPSGYISRFDIYMKESNFEAASKELDRVFHVSPKYPELHYRRATLLSKLGKSKEALQELEEEIRLNPRHVQARIESGNLLVRLGRTDEAMNLFVEAMQLDPSSVGAKIGAGYVNYVRRQYSSAIALYLAALAYDKGNPDIYKKLGLAYRDSGDRTNAGNMFRSYLDLAPDAPDRQEYQQYR